MKLNENLKNTLKKLGVKQAEDCISWLLGVHYGIVSTMPDDINILIEKGLVERGAKGVKLNIELFDTGEIAEGIKKYLAMFRERRLFGNEEVVKKRLKIVMEKFGYSMDTVLKLAEYHLDNEKFPRKPHYFLIKGRGQEILYPIKDTEIEMIHSKNQFDEDFL